MNNFWNLRHQLGPKYGMHLSEDDHWKNYIDCLLNDILSLEMPRWDPSSISVATTRQVTVVCQTTIRSLQKLHKVLEVSAKAKRRQTDKKLMRKRKSRKGISSHLISRLLSFSLIRNFSMLPIIQPRPKLRRNRDRSDSTKNRKATKKLKLIKKLHFCCR